MLLNSLFLSISSSIDSLGIGITYGVRNTKISNVAKVILFFISFVITSISIAFGNILKEILPAFITLFIGNFILIFMGLFMTYQSLKKDKEKDKNIIDNTVIYEQKMYSFFIRCFGITIKIIKDPISSDLDDSKLIDAKEALFLGLAMSLDSFGIGIGSSMLGINSTLFPALVGIMQLLFLSIGNILGRKLHRLNFLPENIWSIISGLLLITIGIVKFFI